MCAIGFQVSAQQLAATKGPTYRISTTQIMGQSSKDPSLNLTKVILLLLTAATIKLLRPAFKAGKGFECLNATAVIP